MQTEMMKYIADTFSKKHSGEDDRKRLLRDLKHNPEFVVEVVRNDVPSLIEEWSREFGKAIHITNDGDTPDAFIALARRVVEYLCTFLQEELSGVSE